MQEGGRYFNPPLSPPARRENPPARAAHRGGFASVLFVAVMFGVRMYLAVAFLASPFGSCKGEEQNASPLT